MLWYVIQTFTGREENLIRMVRKIVPQELYGECFVAYHEQLRCRQQQNQIHVERIFPSYVFVTTDEPDKLFFFLKNVPAMSKLMSDGAFHFLPLETAEAQFLADIMDKNHVIRLSYVATDGRDHVTYVTGPLEAAMRAETERLRGYHFRLRYAKVRLALAGEEKEVRMGIILNNDVRRELTYGKVEAPIAVPEKYRVAGCVTEPHDFTQGEMVRVVRGAFASSTAMIYQIKKHSVVIGVRLFGRDTPSEVEFDDIEKISSRSTGKESGTDAVVPS